MNLTKALKRKAKLANEIQKVFSKLQNSNSHEEKRKPVYSAEDVYNEWLKLINELVELKSKIQVANQPIYSKIFRMAELKSMIQQIKRINTTSGIQDTYRSGEAIEVTMVAFIGELDRDKLIQQWEDEVETLQDEIEEFNALTKI